MGYTPFLAQAEYFGCFEDQEDEYLTSASATFTDTNSVETCQTYCASKGNIIRLSSTNRQLSTELLHLS